MHDLLLYECHFSFKIIVHQNRLKINKNKNEKTICDVSY